ncbi:hypothetical protein ACFT1A_29410 [Rhodococcus sp. NPDC057135]|uniref:hypothetical protein n=1 Tax=Rhodococcus sp. NPDC057135 TaxID=3346028 RepID=UPI00363E72C2
MPSTFDARRAAITVPTSMLRAATVLVPTTAKMIAAVCPSPPDMATHTGTHNCAATTEGVRGNLNLRDVPTIHVATAMAPTATSCPTPIPGCAPTSTGVPAAAIIDATMTAAPYKDTA